MACHLGIGGRASKPAGASDGFQMTCLNPKEFKAQQDYYARTAQQYDEWHNDGEHEHDFALTLLIAYMRFAGVQSVLDIGSGT